MSEENTCPTSEQRDYVRVVTDDQIHYRLLTEEQLELVLSRIDKRNSREGWNSPAGQPTDFQIEVIRRLEALENKLDLVLELMSEHSDGQRKSSLNRGRLTSLSGSGLSFSTADNGDLAAGVNLEILLYLPGFPGQPVVIAAQVVRVEAMEEGGWECAVEYGAIAEPDREMIIAYTFQQQRQAIKRQRRREQAE